MITKLREDLVISIKNHDQQITNCIRRILSKITNKSIEVCRDLTDSEIVDVINKEIKQINETLSYAKNREDITNQCITELNYLKTFIPKQMSEKEILDYIKTAISETEKTTITIGNAMKKIMPELKGKANGKIVADIIKKYFGN